MTEISSSSMTTRDLTLYTMGHSAFQYLYAGLELGVFDLLQEKPGLGREEVARALGLEHLPSRCLLLGLTSLGLLQVSDGRYENSEFVRQVMAKGKLDLLLKVCRFQARIVYAGEVDFLDSLRSNSNSGLSRIQGHGEGLYNRLAEDPSLQTVFFEFMSAWSAESLPLLLAAVDFGGCRSLADVGGGDATIAVALAEAYPHLDIRLLDLPAGCALAERRILAHGLTNRIQTVPCNTFTDDFPAGCDGFLFAHYLVIWSPEENLLLLRKAFAALPAGGRVVIFNSMSSNEGDGPLFAALDSAYFMAIPARGGLIYAWQDYEEWLTAAGFHDVRRRPCHSWWTPHGVVTAVKP